MYSAALVSFPGGLLVLVFTSSARNFSPSSRALVKSGCCATSRAGNNRAAGTARKMFRIIGSKVRASQQFCATLLTPWSPHFLNHHIFIKQNLSHGKDLPGKQSFSLHP